MTAAPLLVVDTATRRPLVALAAADGSLLGVRSWMSRHRHGEQLLGELDALLAEASAQPRDLGGIVVGTGPGSFTGLRIGLATAKVLAYSLGVPLAGVPTMAALAAAAVADAVRDSDATDATFRVAVTLPAGASDRYLGSFQVGRDGVRSVAEIALVADGRAGATADGAALVAVELEPPQVAEEAAARGRAALAGLAGELARLGAARLARGEMDDVAKLVPAYVALPRGVLAAAEEMSWSPDLR